MIRTTNQLSHYVLSAVLPSGRTPGFQKTAEFRGNSHKITETLRVRGEKGVGVV